MIEVKTAEEEDLDNDNKNDDKEKKDGENNYCDDKVKTVVEED